MEPLSEQIRKLNLKKTDLKSDTNPMLVNNDHDSRSIPSPSSNRLDYTQRKVGPCVPPKPFKKAIDHPPQVPQSKFVAEAIVPLYSRPLQCEESFVSTATSNLNPMNSVVRKHLLNETLNNAYHTKSSESTLDNPLVLEQQLEALAYHKQQMEKKGLLAGQREKQTGNHHIPSSLTPMSNQLKLSSNSLVSLSDHSHNSNYSNMRYVPKNCDDDMKMKDSGEIYNNIKKQLRSVDHNLYKNFNTNTASGNSNVYSNLLLQKSVDKPVLDLSSEALQLKLSLKPEHLSISTNTIEQEDDVPPPPSPVSSSYSELRRATEVFATSTTMNGGPSHLDNSAQLTTTDCNTKQKSYANNYNMQYSPAHQNSSAYDSIYEPINPRPPSNMLARTNYHMYAPYVNESQIPSSATASANFSTIGNMHSSGTNTPVYVGNSNLSSINMTLPTSNLIAKTSGKYQKEENAEVFSDLLAHSMNQTNDVEHYGICFKCNERVLGENTGCTAMDQIYHIACFTCWECQINLQGKPFYALEGKPYCQYDYLQTLEKCSVCMKPILERILRATGKPYHPQCFTCVICNRSLDGIPFTVDATNQNYCITDFHKKFAPRCCVCKDPIMPDPGQEETIRVVALDRSFHLECYKCEDCGLLLSSEAEGRGCYPLDDHIFCKSCNAKRVQLLTNTMTTEL